MLGLGAENKLKKEELLGYHLPLHEVHSLTDQGSIDQAALR
jgi:hypothetical protein